jgi:hypothetical protein
MDPMEHLLLILRTARLERELGKLLMAAAHLGASCYDYGDDYADEIGKELADLNRLIAPAYEKVWHLHRRLGDEW